MTLTLTLPKGEFIYTGRQVTFESPCESEGLTGLVVDGVTYDLVSSLGQQLVGNSFDAGAMVSVIFNIEKKKAFVQNADTNAYLESKFNSVHSHSASSITAGTFDSTDVKAKNGSDYSVARVRNIQASTVDLVAGSSPLPSGDIYIVYE